MENTIDNARQFLIDSGRRELENIGYGMTGEFIVAPYQMVTYANSVQQPTQREELIKFASEFLLWYHSPLTTKSINAEMFIDEYLKEKE